MDFHVFNWMYFNFTADRYVGPGRWWGVLNRAMNCKPGALFLNLAIDRIYKVSTYFSGYSFLPYQIGGGGYTSIIFTFLSHIKMLKS